MICRCVKGLMFSNSFSVASTVLAFFSMVHPLVAFSGSLDTSFGTGGIVITPLAGVSSAKDIAIQADGKVVVVGETQRTTKDTVIARYNANGTLDSSFGTGGVAIYDLGYEDRANKVAIQADGKIVVAGHRSGSSGQLQFMVARVTTTGALDTSFAVNGLATLSSANWIYEAHGVAIQTDGKIIAVGSGQYLFYESSSWPVVRLNTDGSFDTGFGAQGKKYVGGSLRSAANAVEVQPNGQILVGGYTVPLSNKMFTMVRLNANGTEDTSFGIDGTSRIGAFLGGGTFIQDICYLEGGSIIAAGSVAAESEIGIIKMLANGAIDQSYGTDGIVQLNRSIGDSVSGIELLDDGGLIIGGHLDNFGSSSALFAKLTANGNLDPTFGPMSQGYVNTFIGTGSTLIFGLAERSPGKWVLVGKSHNGTRDCITLAAFNEGPPNPPELAFYELPNTSRNAGETLVFGDAAPKTSGWSRQFKMMNSGGTALSNFNISVQGGNFVCSELSAASILHGESTSFDITFKPDGDAPGERRALLRILSNDPLKPVFEMTLVGTVLSHLIDSDGDGLNDASEYQLRAFGLDYQSPQQALVESLFSNLKGALPNLNQAGLYAEEQIHTLNINTPVLKRDNGTGKFTLELSLEQSADLRSYNPLPLTIPEVTITPEGKMKFEFSTSASALFFRVMHGNK